MQSVNDAECITLPLVRRLAEGVGHPLLRRRETPLKPVQEFRTECRLFDVLPSLDTFPRGRGSVAVQGVKAVKNSYCFGNAPTGKGNVPFIGGNG